VPLQRWQKPQRKNGKDASIDDASVMRATTPAKLWQQHQLQKSNKDSTLRATTAVQLWQQHQRNKDKEDATATTIKTRQRCQHDKGNNASATWATRPAQQCLADTVALLSLSLLLGCLCCLLQG
jgi:hypothetical protein